MDQNNEPKGIEFETDSYKAVKFYDQTNAPKIVKLVMKYSGGAIKEEKQAYWVLFGFVVMAIIVSLFLFFGRTAKEAKIEAPAGYKIIYPENMPPRLEKIL